MKKRKNDPELVGEREDLGIEVEELVGQAAIHEFALREGAPAEMLVERDDSSSAEPNPAEIDLGLEDLEGQSILDPYAEKRAKEPVEISLGIEAKLEEADVLQPKPGEFKSLK